MAVDNITANLIAGVAGATLTPGRDIVTDVLVEEVSHVVVGTLLPATLPVPAGPSFGLTMEPDAITQIVGLAL